MTGGDAQPAEAPFRILVVSHYFWPEPFRINQLVEDLVAQGAELTVLTGQPNYPGGAVFAGYRAGGMGHERHPAGYDIVRVPVVPRAAGGAMRLVLNYLSFVVTGTLLAPWLLRGRKFDVVFVYCTTPAIQGFVALWLGRIKRAPVVQWVQDLWPQALSATGFIHSPLALGIVDRVVRIMYRGSDLILGQSRAFMRFLKGQAGRTPVGYFPNPGEHPMTAAADPAIRLPAGFNIVFAGNLGRAQALDTVVAAADLLRDLPDVRILLYGSGAMTGWIAAETERLGLTNVVLAGRVSSDAIRAVYAQASALLLTLVDDPILAQTVPSKLQSYLSTGVPIVAAVNGEAAEIVEASGAGLGCPAGDPAALAAAIRRVHAMTPAERAAMGAAGCRFFESRYRPDKLAGELLGRLRNLAAGLPAHGVDHGDVA